MVPSPVVALTFACFGVAQAAGGSGFIACFTGGLVFGGMVKEHKDELLEGAGGGGNLLSLVTWVLFGAAVVGRYVADLDWRVLAYALLCLTLVRMLPLGLSLLDLGVRSDARLVLDGLARVVSPASSSR